MVTVALNPALDVTYHVGQVRRGDSHRVRAVHRRAGGKGLNVARVLHALGRRAVVTGLAGGPAGRWLCEDLDDAGVRHRFLPITGQTRTTITVVDDSADEATVFNEGGPAIAAAEWLRFLAEFPELVDDASAVVLSGSLPPGVPADAYGQLVRAARDSGAVVVVDAEGPALIAAAKCAPAVVKPNAAELRRTTGLTDPLAAAALLRESGAEAVVVTLGADGVLALTPEGAWHGRPTEVVSGNPTGAGDAFAAALAAALTDDKSWPVALQHGLAASAAAVRAPYAGDIDLDAYLRFRGTTTVEELDGSGRDR